MMGGVYDPNAKFSPLRTCCRHDPCWCGLALAHRPVEPPKGIRPWTQEAHDAFISNRDGHRLGGPR